MQYWWRQQRGVLILGWMIMILMSNALLKIPDAPIPAVGSWRNADTSQEFLEIAPHFIRLHRANCRGPNQQIIVMVLHHSERLIVFALEPFIKGISLGAEPQNSGAQAQPFTIQNDPQQGTEILTFTGARPLGGKRFKRHNHCYQNDPDPAPCYSNWHPGCSSF